MNFNVELNATTQSDYDSATLAIIKSRIDSYRIKNLKYVDVNYDFDSYVAHFEYEDKTRIDVILDIDDSRHIVLNYKFNCNREEFPMYYNRCLICSLAILPDMTSVFDTASAQTFERKYVQVLERFPRTPTVRLYGIITKQISKCLTLKTCGLSRFGMPEIIIFAPGINEKTSGIYCKILNRAAIEAFYNKKFLDGGITLAGISTNDNFKLPISLVPSALSPCYDVVGVKGKSYACDCLTIMVYETKSKFTARQGKDLYTYHNMILKESFKLSSSGYQISEWKIAAQETLRYLAKLVDGGTNITLFVSDKSFEDISNTPLINNSMIATGYNGLTGDFIGHGPDNDEEVVIKAKDIYWWQYKNNNEDNASLITPYTPTEYKINTFSSAK